MSASGGPKKQLLCASFNQDQTCLAVGMRSGFKIFKCNPVMKLYESNIGGMAVVEMLFSTSLVALVGSGEKPEQSPRKVRLLNTKTNSFICELNFSSTVLCVLLNKARMVVVLEEKIHIFDLKTMKIIHTLETMPNPDGVVALSPNEMQCYLALPAHDQRGDVMIYDVLNLQVVTKIKAHHNGLHLLAFSRDGTRLATVSEKGTLVRVFSVPQGDKLHTFRRGSYAANVYSIAFNPSATLLCLSSDSSTLHVFDLDPASRPSQESTIANTVAAASSKLTQFLPEVLHDVVDPYRSFARVTMKENTPPTVCGFCEDDKVLVATSAGYLYRFSVPATGGDCKLEAEHALLSSTVEALGVRMHEPSREEIQMQQEMEALDVEDRNTNDVISRVFDDDDAPGFAEMDDEKSP